MKIILTTSCLAVLLSVSSCGKLRNQRIFSNSNKGNIGAISVPDKRNLIASELTLANEICTSLKTKRQNLASQVGKIAYYFNFEKRDCSNTLINTQKFNANIIQTNSDLEYSAVETSEYFTDVITDRSLAIQNICTQVFASSTKISNSSDIGNIRFTVGFTKNDQSYDTMLIVTSTKNTGGVYTGTMAEEISVATDNVQLGASNIGVEKIRSRYTPCKNNQVSTIKETWLNAVTPL